MTHPNVLIERWYALRQSTFGYLEHFDLTQSIDPMTWNGFRLQMDLRADAAPRSPRLRVDFAGVQDLRVTGLHGILRYMIEIRWLGSAQLEGMNFEIRESEYDAFSFVCGEFTADVL